MKNYSDKRYVFIDTETGGIIPGKHSLLSIGIVIWEMMAREPPFSECKFMTEIANKIKAGERPKFKQSHCQHPILKHIVEQCWNEDIKQRLSFDDIDKLLHSIHK